jgi:hypothetical protein
MLIKINAYNRINSKLVILKQNSSYWYAQIKTPPELGIPNNRKRISTGFKIGSTDNYFNAVTFGKNLIDKQKYLHEEGVFLREVVPSVKSVALKTIEQIKNKKIKRKTHREYIRILNSEIIDLLGDIQFNKLGTLDIKNYFKNIKIKSKTSITVRKTCFRKMFDYATDYKIIKISDVPNLKFLEVETSDKEETVIFRSNDFNIIETANNSFVEASKSLITKENRELFKFYREFLKLTGIRTGLETNIKWKDIYLNKTNGNDRIIIHICNGKMATQNKTRDIAIDQKILNVLIELLKYQTIDKLNLTELTINSHQQMFALIKQLKIENHYIFQRKNKKFPRFIDCFDQLKDFLDNRLSSEKLTLYSYRHFFITESLLHEVDIYQLSKYVGNSVNIIEKTYSKVTSILASEYVKKDLNLDKFKVLG